jgi:Asp-tRNA(Asn)/Glu-tRNA(Gln) amidotransferase A subunit family amidase
MTLKDQFNVEGYDSSIGYVGRVFAPAAEDCTLVRMLRSLGAVILAKTNLPQSIMVWHRPCSMYVSVEGANAVASPSGVKRKTPCGASRQTP